MNTLCGTMGAVPRTVPPPGARTDPSIRPLLYDRETRLPEPGVAAQRRLPISAAPVLSEDRVREPEDVRAQRRAEDAALLARIVDKDERAVEALYARYSGPLYSLAYQVTGAERFAQDVVQEVFVALWRDAARFDPDRGAFAPWLFSLARHKAIDLVRREANVRKRTADVDLELHEADDDVDHETWVRFRQGARSRRDRGADAGPARGARARLLRRPHARRGRRSPRHPPGDRQDPYPERPAPPSRHPG